MRNKRSLGKQLYHQLRIQILAGQLPPGTRLLSSRALAKELAISRNTVAEAISQLAAEGYLDSRVGAGTFVSRKLPDHGKTGPAADDRSSAAKPATKLSSRGEAILRRPFAPTSRNRAFMPGLPAIDDFPVKAWSQCAAAASRGAGRQLLEYADPAGDPRLRRAVATYLRTARNVRCDDDQVFIVAGAQDGIDILCRTILEPDDEVIVEEPGYTGLKNVLASWGAVIRPQPLDPEGLIVPVDTKDWQSAKLICVTPSHQFPLGTTMSPGRRFRLLAAAAQTGAWVLEDDYDSEYRHLGNPLPALQGLDRNDQVIHLGSFSKMLFPALRLAYLVVPKSLVDSVSGVRAALGCRAPIASQATLARFIELGHFTRHIRRMRRIYSLRRSQLVGALEGEISGYLKVTNDECGLQVVTEFRDNDGSRYDDRALAAAGEKAGLTLVPLSSFYEAEPRKTGFVLGFGALSEQQIHQSVDRLCALFRDH